VPTQNYAATELREQLERGPSPDEDFFRLNVTGNGRTNWVNITPEQLAGIVALLEGTATAYVITTYRGNGARLFATRESLLAAHAEWLEEDAAHRETFELALDAADAGDAGDIGDGDTITRQAIA
jgi:hypothetical protein